MAILMGLVFSLSIRARTLTPTPFTWRDRKTVIKISHIVWVVLVMAMVHVYVLCTACTVYTHVGNNIESALREKVAVASIFSTQINVKFKVKCNKNEHTLDFHSLSLSRLPSFLRCHFIANDDNVDGNAIATAPVPSDHSTTVQIVRNNWLVVFGFSVDFHCCKNYYHCGILLTLHIIPLCCIVQCTHSIRIGGSATTPYHLRIIIYLWL